MSRYRFELAGPADDADLRCVLSETPMPGPISVAFCREPSYFGAAVVDGQFRQVVACRDTDTGRIVGFGSRAIAERYVNGKPEPIGYLSSLRLLEEHRNRGLVARGYAFFRKLHGDGRTRLYLTTIAEGNTQAVALLTSRRAGLPAYHFAGRYHTIALARGPHRRQPVAEVTVRPARAEDLPKVLAFLHATGPRRQFFPCYQESDFFRSDGALRDLAAGDLLLATRGGRIVGTLAGWDQHGFKQTVIAGYAPLVRWTRPLYNLWARCTGRPRLPPAGQALRYLTVALPVVADDEPTVFAGLLEGLLARPGPWEYVLLGLHESDLLIAVARRYQAVWYTTNLYLVCWDDGDELRASLDGRPPYLELGSL
jgi:hypothetical protein